MRQTQMPRTILSSRSPTLSLVSPTLLGADPKTQGLCTPKSVSPTPSMAQTRKNSVSSSSNVNSTFATGHRPSTQTRGRLALPSPSSRASPSPGSNPTSSMLFLALSPLGPMTTQSSSLSSPPTSAPTTPSAMPNTSSTTCQYCQTASRTRLHA
ncbi:hypothetical protein ID866_11395 [Astraeus odoratus]|nr:hypothetical protein ID866_11395 [Astraeus odoratus]